MWDNRQFNINGRGYPMLVNALRLAFIQEGERTTAKGYIITKKRGMILHWYTPSGSKRTTPPEPMDDVIDLVLDVETLEDVKRKFAKYDVYQPFNRELLADRAAEIVWQWLETKPDTSQEGWDIHYNDGDVSNSVGWRVYCEDWGHVDGHHSAIVAVKPVYLWHGK